MHRQNRNSKPFRHIDVVQRRQRGSQVRDGDINNWKSASSPSMQLPSAPMFAARDFMCFAMQRGKDAVNAR